MTKEVINPDCKNNTGNINALPPTILFIIANIVIISYSI
jgi:hypothetical protein